jgi:serine/threonine protein kinase
MPLVHRDVSPHNVLLTNRGMVKLIDFGLVLTQDRSQETTEPGIVKGKMSYLAPEIVAGGRPVPASDQFACGSVLWEALVGRKLFEGQTDYETYTRLRDCMIQPLRPHRPDVPAAFVQIIQRALSAGIEQRFPSAREMARQIGTTLKKVQLRKDLHTVLAKSVADARHGMGLGPRTGDPSSATPVAQILADDTPRIELSPKVETPPTGLPAVGSAAMEALRGLRHRLPFFGKKRG